MKRNMNFKTLAILLLVLTTQLSAQNSAFSENKTASFYSSFGLGTLKQSFSPFADGMGVTGVAIDITRSANFSNPALLSEYSFTTGYGAFDQSLYMASKDGATSSYSDFKFDGVGLVFPIMKRKLGVALSFNPISTMNYIGEQVGTIPGDTTIVSNNFTGDGGLNEFKTGIGYQLTKNISIGYAPSFLFGSVKKMKTTLFQDLSYRATSSGTNDFYSGLTHEIGLNLYTTSIFSKYDRMNVGLSFRLPSTIDVSRSGENLLINGSYEQPVSSHLLDATMDMPFSFKAGISYNYSNNWIFSSDVVLENWSAFKSLDGGSFVSYKDRLRIGAGVAFIPEVRSSSSYLSSISYRLGGSFDSGYFSVNDNRITRLSANAGISFLSAFTASSVDFNVEFGILGMGQTELVQEEFLSFKFVINLSEFMFFRRQLQ